MPPLSQEPWSGIEKLVIGIDIGTTQTAVSYVHLYPGGPQSVTRVSSWPGQPNQKTSSKIPSIVYYDEKAQPKYFGAEAASDDTKDEAEENGWRLARFFKLHLHPAELRTSHNITTEELPKGVTVELIYSDFLRYLFKHTRAFFESRTPNGVKIWHQLIDDAEFVIAHPNAWGLREQNVLRCAAIKADYVSAAQADSRVRFVSEAEASVHFCIVHGHLGARFKTGSRFLVCDAGGSTIDTIAYIVKACQPQLQLEEAKASGCVQTGGIFVNQEALRQLRRTFTEAKIPEDEMEGWLRISEEEFERSLKIEFPRPSGRHTITVDRQTYNNRAVGIKNGRLSLTTETVASFFEPCISQIKAAIKEQLSGFAAEHILLVGGFGESRYLQQQLRETFIWPTCDVTIIEDGTSKAVADGSVIWHCLQTVKTRVARCSFGAKTRVPYNAVDPSHQGRALIRGPEGLICVGNIWDPILAKGTAVHEDVIQSYYRTYLSIIDAENDLASLQINLYSHHGTPGNLAFMCAVDEKLYPGFERACVINADMRQLAKSMEPLNGTNTTFFKASFDVGITFGDTELKAFVEWKENGVKKRGPATVIPDALVQVYTSNPS